MEIRLSDGEYSRERDHLHPVERGPPAEPAQSARKSQGDVRDRGGAFARSGGVRNRRRQAVGKLVDALEPMAVDPLGRQGPGAERLGQRGVSARPTSARNLCVQCVSRKQGALMNGMNWPEMTATR